MRKIKMPVIGMLACCMVCSMAHSATVVSPDGKNELRLEVGEKGLEYAVLRLAEHAGARTP